MHGIHGLAARPLQPWKQPVEAGYGKRVGCQFLRPPRRLIGMFMRLPPMIASTRCAPAAIGHLIDEAHKPEA